MTVRSVRFDSGGLRLEGRLGEPDAPATGGAIICHPHPLYAGSMSSALIPALQRSLLAAGFVVLRFNFRGVGRSEGAYDHGDGETDDALAALREVAPLVPSGKPLLAAGWSFGSVIALRAAVRDERVTHAAGIALPVGDHPAIRRLHPPDPGALVRWGKPVLLIAGEKDEIAPAADAIRWGRDARAHVDVIRGAGHFFTGHFDEVAALLLAFAPPAARGDR